MSIKIIASVLAFVTVCGFSFSIFAEADSEGRSEARSDLSENRFPHRFVRRVIVEGSRTGMSHQGIDAPQYSNPMGYSTGLVFDIAGKRNFVVELGALYRQEDTTINNGFINDRFRTQYISVPLSAKYYFIDQEFSSPYVKVGAMGSFLVSDNTVTSASAQQVGAQSWETALMGGLGYKVYATTLLDFLVEADYIRGLDSLFPDTNAYRSDLSLGLGVAFNF